MIDKLSSILLKQLIKSSKQRLIVPFYHAVSNSDLSFTNNLYLPRKITDFENDLDTLLKFYKPISLDKLKQIVNSKEELKENYFHLTFDDGLSNFFEIVAPILKKREIPATMFLNTNFVDNKELFYRYKASLLLNFYTVSNTSIKKKFYDYMRIINNPHKKVATFLLNIKYKNRLELDNLARFVGFNFNEFLKLEKPYLTKNQIEELIKQGFTFGGHSIDHPYYSELSVKEQIEQTKNSLNWVKNELKIDYKVFSFPFTDDGVSSKYFTHIFTNNMVDLSFGTAGIKKDSFQNNIQRVPFEIDSRNLKSFLITEYIKYFMKYLVGKQSVKRN